jgi:hypothetical protein
MLVLGQLSYCRSLLQTSGFEEFDRVFNLSCIFNHNLIYDSWNSEEFQFKSTILFEQISDTLSGI